MTIYKAEVDWYDEFNGNIVTEKVIIMACNWSDAVEKICTTFGADNIDSISELEVVGDGSGSVIMLGNGEDADIALQIIERENCF